MNKKIDKDGIVLIHKSEGITSAESLNKIKRNCGIKSFGHAGTLDPFATGLLIACTGRATKILPYFTDLFKVYQAEFQFGEKTDTDDITGKIIERSIKKVTLNEIKQAIPFFVGKINQIPPQFSAVKVDGKRAYDLARENKSFVLTQKEVQVFNFDIFSFNEEAQILKVIIHCSKGTYIRSLARDLGESLGSGAYVKSLSRESIGAYTLQDAKQDITITNEDILEVQDFFKGLPKMVLKKEFEKLVLNGKSIEPYFLLQGHSDTTDGYIPAYYTLHSEKNEFIALVNNITHKALFMVISL